MTLEEKVDLILAEVADLKKQVVAITVMPPAPPIVQDIWTGLKLDDPLAEHDQTAEGWINLKRRSESFPGDRQMLRDAWDGLDPATGKIYHAGNAVMMATKRREALSFHAADLTGTYGDTLWGQANTSPECAAVLVLLSFARTNAGWLGSDAQFSPGAWPNLTDLNSLFLKLKSISEGTGGPSGQP